MGLRVLSIFQKLPNLNRNSKRNQALHYLTNDLLDSLTSLEDTLLELAKNVCGQKQAGHVWNRCLADKLVYKVGLRQSKADECMFFKGRDHRFRGEKES